jgi:excisionase family DNA binding protein
MAASTAPEVVGQRLMYTVRDVAQMTQLSERTIRRAVASGKLRVKRFGRALRIPKESVEDFAGIGPARTDVQQGAPANVSGA